MKTKKQAELIESFLSGLETAKQPLFRELILHLSDRGYNPHKQRSFIVFKHDLHNKQIAKIGMRGKKNPDPFFALRFSACRNYTERFAKIVRAAVTGEGARPAACMSGECGFCAGDAPDRVYTLVMSDGAVQTACGAGALDIPDITAADIPDIKKLIDEENRYLLKHQSGIDNI